MNGYEFSRRWFDWAFENTERVKPVHSALYFFIIEHCNRLGWKESFGLPSLYAMSAIGVKSHNTYISALNDLIEFGFIILKEKSKNQFTANIIALSKFDIPNDGALDRASANARSKFDITNLPTQLDTQILTEQQDSSCVTNCVTNEGSTDDVDKPLNLKTLKPLKEKDMPIEVEGFYKDLIDLFNSIFETRYLVTNDRLKQFKKIEKAKIPIDEIKKALELKKNQWETSEKMKHHLNPDTLLNFNKLEKYIEEYKNVKPDVKGTIKNNNKSTPERAGEKSNNEVFTW